MEKDSIVNSTLRLQRKIERKRVDKPVQEPTVLATEFPVREGETHLARRVKGTVGTRSCVELYHVIMRETLFSTLKPMAITIQGQILEQEDPTRIFLKLKNYLLKTKVKHCILIQEFSSHYHYHGIIWRTESAKPREDVLTYKLKVTTKEITHLKTWLMYMYKTNPPCHWYLLDRETDLYLATTRYLNLRQTALQKLWSFKS